MMSKLLALWLVILPCVWGQAVMSGLLSTAYGPGLRRATVGEPTQFWIQAVDTNGVNMTVGGAAFKITMKTPYGGQGSKPTITDLGTGLYHVTYTIAITYPPLTGMYTMEVIVEVNGVKMNMRNSPFSIQVIESAPFDVSRTHALSPPDFEVAGSPGQFKVIASDSNGNVLTQGYLTFVATMTDGEASVTYTGADGEYMVNFLSTKTGTAQLSVQAGAPLQHISGSPFSIFVSSAGVAAQNCEVSGPALLGGVSGKITSFAVTEHDVFGNTRTTTSSVNVSARFENDVTKVAISKQKNGTWIGTFVAPAGVKKLHVEIDGTPVQGSPFQVVYTKPSQAGTIFGVIAGVGVLGGAFLYYRKHTLSQPQHQAGTGGSDKYGKASTDELASDSDDGIETGVY